MKNFQSSPPGATDHASQSSGSNQPSLDKLDELKDSQHFHNVIDVQNTQVTTGLPESRQIINEQLYVFSKVGNTVDRDLHIRDIVESNLEEHGLQVKYPVCFECFDKILTNLDEKTKEKEV